MIRPCPHCQARNRIPPRHLHRVGRCGACHQPLPPMDQPLAVDAATFDAVISDATVPVLVDFWAPWCGPCRMAAPEVEKAARDLAGQALVLKVDTEAQPALAARFQIRSIPTFAVFVDGAVRFQQAGLLRQPQLVALARQHGARG